MNIIFFILFILLIFYVVSKVNLNHMGYWLLGGYSVILLAVAALYFFIPTEEILTVEELEDEGVSVDIMDNVAYRGQSIDDFEQYKVEEWEFEATTDETLYLAIDSDQYHVPVLIKEVNNTATINAALYHVQSPFNFEKLDGGPELAQLQLEKNQLNIITPPTMYFAYASMTKEFPFTQFSDRVSEEFHPPDLYYDAQVLYLKVPEGQALEIDDDIYYEDVE